MANLYTLKTIDEAMSPLQNYSGNNANLRTLSGQYYNTIGRDTGTTAANTATTNSGFDLLGGLESRLSSIKNALGTTGSAIVSPAVNAAQNAKTENLLKDNRAELDTIAQKYGFADYNGLLDAQDKADAAGTPELYDNVWLELQDATARQSDTMKKNAEDYRNSYVTKKLSQDREKFAGSAINTLSTAFDVMAPGAGILANTVQGGIEGIADELEQNGKNFNWENAANRAITGAATGTVTGALNKGLNTKLANNGGNFFKGANKYTKGIDKFENILNNKTAGIMGSAARGALTGSVGGATSAGLSSALSGADLGTALSNALTGAAQGAAMGGATGGVMGAANVELNGIKKAANALKTKALKNAGQEQTTKLSNQTLSTDNTNQTTDGKDITSSFDMNETPIKKTNKVQNIGKQLKTASESIKYSDLYGNLDNSTAKRAVETQAPQKLAALDVKPQDYTEYAKTSNYVNGVVSDLAKESGVKVNVPDLADRLSSDNVDAIMTDNATKKYNQIVKQIVADGDSPTEFSASYLLEKSRELGNKAANLRGNTDDVTVLRSALTQAKYTLRDLATNALETSEITGDLTNDNIAAGLKKLGANEKVIDYYTAASGDKAPSVSDYIRRSSLFEQARDMGTQYQAEKLTRSASKEPTNPFTQIYNASGLQQPINTILRNTIAPLSSMATKAVGSVTEGLGTIGNKVNTAYNTVMSEVPKVDQSSILWNQIGRDAGQNQTNTTTQPSTLEELTAYTSTPSTSNVYSTLSGKTGNTGTTGNSNLYTTTGTTSSTANNYGTSTTDNSQLDLITRAMQIALDANDAIAYGQLYTMYQDALEKANSSSNSVQNWNASAKTSLTNALNGLSQIDQLEQAYNSAVTAGSDDNWLAGTLRGLSTNIAGGNLDPTATNYQKLAESAGMAIVKNLVNLGVTEADAKRYLEYLPTLSDSAELAKTKLDTLRAIYQEQINNLYSVNS